MLFTRKKNKVDRWIGRNYVLSNFTIVFKLSSVGRPNLGHFPTAGPCTQGVCVPGPITHRPDGSTLITHSAHIPDQHPVCSPVARLPTGGWTERDLHCLIFCQFCETRLRTHNFTASVHSIFIIHIFPRSVLDIPLNHHKCCQKETTIHYILRFLCCKLRANAINIFSIFFHAFMCVPCKLLYKQNHMKLFMSALLDVSATVLGFSNRKTAKTFFSPPKTSIRVGVSRFVAVAQPATGADLSVLDVSCRCGSWSGRQVNGDGSLSIYQCPAGAGAGGEPGKSLSAALTQRRGLRSGPVPLLFTHTRKSLQLSRGVHIGVAAGLF
ncbi:hypothetical protein ANANG_G00080780 [Anguilla anguilla]|uniref:Uncharacterized protein n=1 Tax=Anguilla anguilla TaxID=7936 RepID=A0A9D3S2X9_ANGAN|nr:hypothetical protein ANANG_G00080780 [Anguilla anguilla]